MANDAIVVLGCAVRGAKPSDALLRRIRRAVALYRERGECDYVVVSGGKPWDGHVEADVMAEECVSLGIAPERILRERCSISTKENARFVQQMLERRGIRHTWLVTCDWHMSRALAHFRKRGVSATPYPASATRTSRARGMRMMVRECVASGISWVLE